MEGHDPAAAQSVSAVLLSLKGAAGFQLDMKYNKQGNQATLAWPVATTLATFFDRLSWFEDIWLWCLSSWPWSELLLFSPPCAR